MMQSRAICMVAGCFAILSTVVVASGGEGTLKAERDAGNNAVAPSDLFGVIVESLEVEEGGLQEVGLEVLRHLAVLRRNGPIGVDELSRALCNPPRKMTRDDAEAVDSLFQGLAGEKEIDSAQLAVLYRAKRDAIESISCDIDVSATGGWAGHVDGGILHSRFRLRGRDILLDRVIKDIDSGKTISRHAVSMTSKLLRRIEGAGTKESPVIASVEYPSERRFCYDRFDPLSISRLLNSQRDLGCVDGATDLASARHPIYPGRAKWQGHNVIVLGALEHRIYLAPHLNYALIGVEKSLAFDDEEGRFVTPETVVRIEWLDFKNYGDSLWLPSNVKFTSRNKGEIDATMSVNYSNIEVNKPIRDSEFSLFPQGTLVYDFVNHTSFVEGENNLVQSSAPGAGRTKAEFNDGRFILGMIGVSCLLLLGICYAAPQSRSRTGKAY